MAGTQETLGAASAFKAVQPEDRDARLVFERMGDEADAIGAEPHVGGHQATEAKEVTARNAPLPNGFEEGFSRFQFLVFLELNPDCPLAIFRGLEVSCEGLARIFVRGGSNGYH